MPSIADYSGSRPGDPLGDTDNSLVGRIERAARSGRRVTFVLGGEEEVTDWGAIHHEARGIAAALQARGIRPGDHVALLSPTTRPLVATIQATWLAGATLVVLPLPMRLGSIEEFVAQTRRRIHHADARLVVIDPELAAFVTPEPDDPPMVGFDELVGDPDAWVRPPVDPERLTILQFTSGSTADPKGVMLPDRAVCANLDGIAEAAELDPGSDVLVSWLPLYHDMGLVGLLTLPMSTGTPLVLGAPQDFTSRPSRWMEWISAYGGTATAGPNFSYVLATRALKNGPQLDLSTLRVALNGAEPIDADNMEDFIAAAERHGLRPGAVFPAFGMAEVSIGGTFPPPGRGLVTDCVDRRVLETERYAAPAEPSSPGSRRFARLGYAVPGLEIRIVDPETGNELKDREVGELEIRGTSVTTGYYKRPDANAELFHDGWLRTGDLAYLVDGELVVCGRIKDVIIVGGRNVFPEDVERAVGLIDGVRAGNVIAFGATGARGREALVVVAETRADDFADLRHRVAERVVEVVGVPARDIVLVAPGTLPKTSSGKLQRSLCKRRYEDGQLVLVDADV
ncbi:MAG TPA: AMP-binding protein [Acidimicrobiales bacterium]